jgi:hypothetical protein
MGRKLESVTYWKLKALELEGQVLHAQVRQTLARFEQRRQEAYAQAGLDAAVVYDLDDEAETFTPQVPPPAPPPAAPAPIARVAKMKNRPTGAV